MPSNIKWSFFGQYLLSTEWNTSGLPLWEIYWDNLRLPNSSYFLPHFLKIKMMVNRCWAISLLNPVACVCTFLNLLPSQEWIPQTWFNMLGHFSLIDSSLPIEPTQHRERWLIIPQIHKLTFWQSCFFAILGKVFNWLSKVPRMKLMQYFRIFSL